MNTLEFNRKSEALEQARILRTLGWTVAVFFVSKSTNIRRSGFYRIKIYAR